jgi:hypothetical protein
VNEIATQSFSIELNAAIFCAAACGGGADFERMASLPQLDKKRRDRDADNDRDQTRNQHRQQRAFAFSGRSVAASTHAVIAFDHE